MLGHSVLFCNLNETEFCLAVIEMKSSFHGAIWCCSDWRTMARNTKLRDMWQSLKVCVELFSEKESRQVVLCLNLDSCCAGRFCGCLASYGRLLHFWHALCSQTVETVWQSLPYLVILVEFSGPGEKKFVIHTFCDLWCYNKTFHRWLFCVVFNLSSQTE